jgi:hypothetical protein
MIHLDVEHGTRLDNASIEPSFRSVRMSRAGDEKNDRFDSGRVRGRDADGSLNSGMLEKPET